MGEWISSFKHGVDGTAAGGRGTGPTPACKRPVDEAGSGRSSMDLPRVKSLTMDHGTEARPFRGGRRSRTPAMGRKDGEKLRNTHDVNTISLAHRGLEFFVPFEVLISGHQV